MQGTRRDRLDGSSFQSGEIGKAENGVWYCCPPNTDLLGNLSGHEVIENADGTISVTPSILIRGCDKQWHGYLIDGEWIEV